MTNTSYMLTTHLPTQDVAERVAREAIRVGLHPSVLPMDAFDINELPNIKKTIFVTSTMGQGDPPSNMQKFWRFLLRKRLPLDSLQQMHFSVFGLGDSHYQKYNVAAKKLFKRLENLGAKSIIQIGLGDDQHPGGHDAALDPWLEGLWRVLGGGDGGVNAEGVDRCKYQVNMVVPNSSLEKLDVNHPPSVETLLAGKKEMDRCENAATPVDLKYLRRKEDYMEVDGQSSVNTSKQSVASVVGNVSLTTENAIAQTKHVELNFAPKHLANNLTHTVYPYQVGDCLEVTPFSFFHKSNGEGYGKFADVSIEKIASDESKTKKENKKSWSTGIDYLLKRSGVDPESFLTVRPFGDAEFTPTAVSARILIASSFDIASASPRRYFYETAARFTKNPDEQERLIYFASPSGRDDLHKYGARERRTVLEFLDDFPSVEMPLGWFLATAPRLKPRLFSISSSSSHDGGKNIHLTVTVAKWRTHYGRTRYGLCSNLLSNASDCLPIGARVAARVVPGAYAFPAPGKIVIAVCTGSGVAPVRAMVRDRHVSQKNKKKVAPTLVFFGCRHKDRDFLYAEEWAGLGGVLRGDAPDGGSDPGSTPEGGFVPCFSREGKKQYVSHAIRERAKNVWAFLKTGASVVVCGSAGAMPEDVFDSFVFVCQHEGGMDETQARAFLRKMDARGEYVVEAW